MNEKTEMVKHYDEEAEACGWYGPEIIFGLMYKFVKPGEKLVDLGIGTGLSSELFYKAGLKISGIDIDENMLEACGSKFPDANFTKQNLNEAPYPFESESIDFMICAGVMNFFNNLSVFFSESARILKPEGKFGFITADLKDGMDKEIIVGSEHTHSDRKITMYRHSAGEIRALLSKNGMKELRNLEFVVQMDRERSRNFPARGWIAGKI